MSKSVKNLIMSDYKARFEGAGDAMVVSIRGVNGVQTTRLRGKLAKKNIRVTVIRNNLARKSFEGTSLAKLGELLTGPSALAFGGSSVVEVAREIVGLVKDFPGLELKGAVLDGQLFSGDAGVKELSKFPTKSEAIAEVVTLLVSPGRTLMGQIKGPGAKVAGIVKAIEERLEKGETISKVG